MDELWVLVAHLADAAEVALWLRAEIRAAALRREDAVPPCILDDAHGRISRDQEPVLRDQGVYAKSLEVQRQRQEVWRVVDGQTDRGVHTVAGLRARDRVQVDRLIVLLVVDEQRAPLPQLFGQDLHGRLWKLREVLLPQILQDGVQLRACLQKLHLLPSRAVLLGDTIETRIDVLLWNRDAAPDEGVQVNELLVEGSPVALHPLDATGDVLLQVQQVAEVLPVVQQVAPVSLPLLFARPRPIARRALHRQDAVGKLLAELRDLVDILLHTDQQLISFQPIHLAVQRRQANAALVLVLVE
mmetsp:Transcript_73343/g.185788  ORF Transcript_73343/g.185788 Transcript_73343/m.185788 type:complete len:300 (-) Transcript_73343:598-1497(-)